MSTEASEKKDAPSAPPQGAPCWIEIMSVDPPKLKVFFNIRKWFGLSILTVLKQFYSQLFPAWKWKAATAEYKEEDIAMYEFEQPKSKSSLPTMPLSSDSNGQQISQEEF